MVDRGLTLLEILVSVAIISVVMGIIYGAYTSNVEIIKTTRGSSQVYQTARIVMDRMSRDLESAFIGAGSSEELIRPGFLCINQEMDGRPADRLNFAALTYFSPRPNSPGTDLCEIGYYLEEDEERGGLILYRRSQIGVDDDLASGGVAVVFSKNVVGLDLTFQDGEGETFESWDSFEGEQKGRLPSLVIIKLLIAEPQGREVTFTTAVHPETAEAGK